MEEYNSLVADKLDNRTETPRQPGQRVSASIPLGRVELVSPRPSNDDFRHIGFTQRQIHLLEGQPDYIRQEVMDEALRLLMERESGSDSLSNFLAVD